MATETWAPKIPVLSESIEEEEEEFIFHIITNNMQCNYYILI